MATDSSRHFRVAYERHLVDMRAMDASAVKKVNLDIPAAGQTVLGVVGRLEPFREALLGMGVSPPAIEQLASRTRAMLHAHTEWLFASTPKLAIAPLVAEGMAARERLALAGKLFAAYGHDEAATITELRGGLGHRNLAMDLLGLAMLLRPLVAKVGRAFLVTEEELDHVEKLGEQILAALGERQQSSSTASEASQLRDRAFTLFIDAYTEVRQGMMFLRWKAGDGKTFTPSLYGGNGRRRGAKSESIGPTSASTVTSETADHTAAVPTHAGIEAADRGSRRPAQSSVAAPAYPVSQTSASAYPRLRFLLTP